MTSAYNTGNPAGISDSPFVKGEPTKPQGMIPSPRFAVGDIADKLPESVRDKFKRLRDQCADLQAVRAPIRAEIDRLRDDRYSKQATLNRLKADRRSKPGAIAPWEQALTRIDEQIAYQQRRLDELDSASGEKRAILTACENYLRDADARRLTARQPMSVTPPKDGNGWGDIVAEVRDDIRAVKAKIQFARNAPKPSSEVRARARAMIEGIASCGTPDVFSALEGNGDVTFKPGPIEFIGDRTHRAPIDVFTLLVWLCKDQMIKKLDDLITEKCDDDVALSDRDRRAKIEELSSILLNLEHYEIAFIEAAASDNVVIARRADCDARALLGVDGPSGRR